MRKMIRKFRRFTTGKTFVRMTALVAIVAIAVLAPIHMAYATTSSGTAANNTVAVGSLLAIGFGVAAAMGCPPCAAAAAGFAAGSAILTWLTAPGDPSSGQW
jgi:hypothetical protein